MALMLDERELRSFVIIPFHQHFLHYMWPTILAQTYVFMVHLSQHNHTRIL